MFSEFLKQESSEDLERLLSALPCLIGFVDTKLTLRHINQNFANWYNVSMDKIIGQTLPSLLGEALYSQRRPYIDTVLAGKMVKFIGPALHPVLGIRDTEITYLPHHDTNGVLDGFLIIVRDVTSPSTEAGSNDSQNESGYHELVDRLPILIWNTGPNGLQYLNSTFTSYTGKRIDDLKDMKWLNHVHPDEREGFLKRYDEGLRYQELFSYTFRFRREDGVYRWFHTICRPRYNFEGMFLGFLSTTMDITCVKRIQTELVEAKEKAERADRAKLEFLANMSHEIRTPMNAVIGIANLLEDRTIDHDRQDKFIKTLKMSAEQLLSLINDILDVAKMEGDALIIEKTPFILKPVVDEVMDICSVKAAEKNISLRCVYASNVEKQYLGDPYRLRQILMNIVGNAIKFTNEGHVLVSVQTMNDNVVEFKVADTGIGIEEDKIDHIFNKFTQADNSVSRKYGGSGLGLAICKKLVELMQGQINVKSRIGEGTTFSILLPLVKAEQQKANLAAVKNPANDYLLRKVLLVEDNEANILVGKMMLEQCRCNVSVATSGEEAISMMRENTYDLVFMDVQMPGMGGQKAVQLWREEEERTGCARTKIIAMTANALKGDKELCLMSGMDDYLAKPFSIEIVQQKLIA